MPEILRTIQAVIDTNDTFAVFCHVRPDGDGLGAAAALTDTLRTLGKTAVVGIPDVIPQRYDFIDWHDALLTHPPDTPPDVMFVLDCASLERTGCFSEMIAKAGTVVNIDHHATNTGFGTLNWVEHGVSSTSEQVYELIRAGGYPLTDEAAAGIYIGILTDTNRFANLNTTPRSVEIVSALLTRGLDTPRLLEQLYQRVQPAVVMLLSRALASLALHDDGRIASIQLKHADFEELGASTNATHEFINFARNIDGVEASLFACEMGPGGEVKVTLRAKGRVDVAAIAARFGGGGHMNAAGCSFACPLDEAVRTVVEAAQKEMENAS